MTGSWSYYLYTGQAENLQKRLRDHENAWYRSRHPYLHYWVWDSLPAYKSTFIVLAQCTKKDPIALNLLEAWGALIFQTLPKEDLIEYLPDDTVLFPQAGSHLNIAHPLWQSISETKQDIYVSTDPHERKKRFSELIRDSDGAIKEYYLAVRQSFLDLKYSSNPALRAYYFSAYQRRGISQSTSTRKRTRDEILEGAIKKVSGLRNGLQTIYFDQIRLRIRKGQIRLHDSDKVHIQGYLTQGVNPNVYATNATSDDPARRLSLQLTVERQGRHSSIWLTAGGDKTVMGVNTLVDILEDVPYDDIEKSPRRFLRTDESKNRPVPEYSS
jgi:hypothetical protein